MDYQQIAINEPARRAWPLARIAVGRASAAELLVLGAPREIEDLRVHFSRPGGKGSAYAVKGRLSGGGWKVYASGLNFPEEGNAEYNVTAIDSHGNAVWLGRGALSVLPSVLHDAGGEAPIVPADTYIRNPATGLWHLLTVEVDESGALVPVLGEGVER